MDFGPVETYVQNSTFSRDRALCLLSLSDIRWIIRVATGKLPNNGKPLERIPSRRYEFKTCISTSGIVFCVLSRTLLKPPHEPRADARMLLMKSA